MSIPRSVAPLIAAFMPRWSLRQVDRVAVAAPPERAYALARGLDMSRVGAVRALFALRVLPDRIAAGAGRRSNPAPSSLRIDDIVRPGSGFLLLAEAPGREVVVGSVGTFWRPNIAYAAVTPANFTAFEEAGFGKLAWNIRVDPRDDGGSWITVELRVGATDAASLARFRRYWKLVGPFSHAIRRAMLRMLRRELGAAPPDDRRALPGDEALPEARFQRTHAVTIEAPADHVWPWLVQMGARRAGWYSFDTLDNDGMPSATAINPGLQRIAVGDVIPALPRGPDGFVVLRVEAERVLVLGDPSLLERARPAGAPPWRTSWAFVLEPIGPAATRLVVRARADYAPRPGMLFTRVLMGAAHEVMERRQLRNLRRRAEEMA
jgi:hypothetical protein